MSFGDELRHLFDDSGHRLYCDAVIEAQENGDDAVGGQHLMLAMALRQDPSWQVLRWAGCSPLKLNEAGLRATKSLAPHNRDVPCDPALRAALYAAWHGIECRPLSSTGILTGLVATKEKQSTKVLQSAGVDSSDVLNAVSALARLDQVDRPAALMASMHTGRGDDHTEGNERRRRGIAESNAREEVAGLATLQLDSVEQNIARSVAYRRFTFFALAILLTLINTVAICSVVAAVALAGRTPWLLLIPLAMLVASTRFGPLPLAIIALLCFVFDLNVACLLTLVAMPIKIAVGTLRHWLTNPPIERRDLRFRGSDLRASLSLGDGALMWSRNQAS